MEKFIKSTVRLLSDPCTLNNLYRRFSSILAKFLTQNLHFNEIVLLGELLLLTPNQVSQKRLNPFGTMQLPVP